MNKYETKSESDRLFAKADRLRSDGRYAIARALYDHAEYLRKRGSATGATACPRVFW